RAGFGEFLREVAVVGHEEKAFAGVVETANGIEPFFAIGDKFHDGGAAFGIADRGDVAFRFAEHVVDQLLGALELLAVHADLIGGGIGFLALFGDDDAVYGDAACGDDFFSFAAGGKPGGGGGVLQAAGGAS